MNNFVLLLVCSYLILSLVDYENNLLTHVLGSAESVLLTYLILSPGNLFRFVVLPFQVPVAKAVSIG